MPREKLEKHSCWKGGKTHTGRGGTGYVLIKTRVAVGKNKGYELEHILIAERVLGKPLPVGASVHHVNGIKNDNRNENLVICENEAYHQLLHRRMRALKACEHADWRKCQYCGVYDDPANMLQYSNGSKTWHRECAVSYCRKYDAEKRDMDLFE